MQIKRERRECDWNYITVYVNVNLGEVYTWEKMTFSINFVHLVLKKRWMHRDKNPVLLATCKDVNKRQLNLF
jgi:hypothetical protein